MASQSCWMPALTIRWSYETGARLEQNAVAVGLDGDDGVLHPSDALRHHGCLRAHGHARRSGAPGDVREERLVEVLGPRFDDHDVFHAESSQASRDGESAVAAADHHDSMVLCLSHVEISTLCDRDRIGWIHSGADGVIHPPG